MAHDDVWAADKVALIQWLASNNRPSGSRSVPKANGPVSVLSLQGPVTKRGGWFVAGTDELMEAFDDAMAAPNVAGILLDIDSPGGSASGLSEFADHIRSSRGTKPIVAHANPTALSAAYWIGTSADKLYMSPSGEVGSVGVWSLHMDYSQAMDEMGIKPTFISAGKYKVEGNPFEPLSDEAREEMQASVDEVYKNFVGAVAQNRGVSRSDVLENFGQGRAVRPGDALKAGMVDGVDSLQGVLKKMGAGQSVDAARARRERMRSR